nr:retrovirus-related Pol polyprotein from transposon TNT 1-94 [Tanacetum cinerariifolium]
MLKAVRVNQKSKRTTRLSTQELLFSSTPEQNGVAERKNRTLIEDHLRKFDTKANDRYFLVYAFNSKAFRVFNIRRQQIKETYHVTFNESIEAIRRMIHLDNIKQVLMFHTTSFVMVVHSQNLPKKNMPLKIDGQKTNTLKLYIIGDPDEGMLTRSMATKLTAASASKCLFADFLCKIEPKKVSEALTHPGWVDAMQEELNQFYRNKL